MRPLPIRTQEVIYRVAQECLQNIVKHSEASRVHVWLRAADKISSWAFTQRADGCRTW
jgi:signal transduction histidine kinase